MYTGRLKTIKDGQCKVRLIDGTDVHAWTVKRHLQKLGVKAYVQQKKPGLTPPHIVDWLELAKTHSHWIMEDWKNVMFLDETAISCVVSFGRKFYYSDKEHKWLLPHQIKATKQCEGGIIILWGCMTYYEVGNASWVPGKIDSEAYANALKEYVLASRD